ncbi:MAG: hypothetical protein JWM04_197 [Verrucomicrobiales bacterium]|nr:hypothetical protein [Verrucomicrobiales bacterium]
MGLIAGVVIDGIGPLRCFVGSEAHLVEPPLGAVPGEGLGRAVIAIGVHL